MNAAVPAKKSAVMAIEDIQGRPDTRRIPINKVGIKDIYHPVKVKDRASGEQHTVANFNMYVNLPHDFMGTHMSRFVDVLHRHEREISVELFGQMLAEMTDTLDATAGHTEMTFPYFVMKKAPVSGISSLCPCSKAISKYGAHNQRSHITIAAKIAEHMWLEELIDVAEKEAPCELYGMLKRTDEKFVTERAYDNPKFVEDIVRDVALVLNGDARVRAFVVEAENFESIHNHSAYAMIEHEKDSGG